MADFADYLRATGIANRKAIASAAMENTDSIIQMFRNKSAPSVSGSGAGSVGGGYASLTPEQLNLPALKGGKVIPVNAKVSQNWGASRIKYAAGRHTGMDFGAKTGTRVGAAGAGVVVGAGRNGAYGNAVRIRHSDGTTSLYAHLNNYNVKAGQKVKAGQQIGTVGNTGRSFGSHLHFEVRKVDKYGGDINPKSWFSTR